MLNRSAASTVRTGSQSSAPGTGGGTATAPPLDYRAPLVLRDVEGLSTREAAEVMGLGEAAFKSRLHRARLAVRRSLDEYFLEASDS
ncbi:MAG: hypothetical protein H0X55_00340 [Thermoleophilaceae bacterium]|nr:hypothetical protein [Thermoleophilaceae bacterium]